MDNGGGSHRFLTSLIADMVWLAKKEGFLQQPLYSVLWVACWLRLSHSALVCGSVCLIHCGTVVHSACWYNISAGEHKWASIGVLQYTSRAKYGSWAEHLAWVSNPLTVFMAASVWPLLLGFLGELVLLSNFQSVANLVKSALANWEPLLVWSTYECHVLWRVPLRLRWSWRHCIEMQGFLWWWTSWSSSLWQLGIQIHQSGSSQCWGVAIGIPGPVLAGAAVVVPVGSDVGMLGMIQQGIWCLSWFWVSIYSV